MILSLRVPNGGTCEQGHAVHVEADAVRRRAGWWLGILGSEVGWFPKSYCVEISNDCIEAFEALDVPEDVVRNALSQHSQDQYEKGTI